MSFVSCTVQYMCTEIEQGVYSFWIRQALEVRLHLSRTLPRNPDASQNTLLRIMHADSPSTPPSSSWTTQIPFPIIRAYGFEDKDSGCHPPTPPPSPCYADPQPDYGEGFSTCEYSHSSVHKSKTFLQRAIMLETTLSLERQIDILYQNLMRLSQRGWMEGHILRTYSASSQEYARIWWDAVEYYARLAWIVHAELINIASKVYRLDGTGDYWSTFERYAQLVPGWLSISQKLNTAYHSRWLISCLQSSILHITSPYRGIFDKMKRHTDGAVKIRRLIAELRTGVLAVQWTI